ncbi:hypothetical protein E4U45_006244 [Claviceps purpurea]|nr:hypothetical protein E4U45_006244 [Claviceps purpurea]
MYASASSYASPHDFFSFEQGYKADPTLSPHNAPAPAPCVPRVPQLPQPLHYPDFGWSKFALGELGLGLLGDEDINYEAGVLHIYDNLVILIMIDDASKIINDHSVEGQQGYVFLGHDDARTIATFTVATYIVDTSSE